MAIVNYKQQEHANTTNIHCSRDSSILKTVAQCIIPSFINEAIITIRRTNLHLNQTRGTTVPLTESCGASWLG
ncbi:MAG: hypothetical protein GY820_03680 [Gammaproteobacteria bacterium]|nr:hypothetical protein [Gammaproteobacteria bacterium]